MNKNYILNTILATEDDAIVVIAPDCKVLFWNDAAVQTYTIHQDEIIGKPITDFFKDEDLLLLYVLKTKQPVKNAYHRPREDKHVVINSAPIYNDNNELIGVVSIDRDVSNIVRLNENLLSTSTELNELKRKIYMNKEETPFSKMKGRSPALQKTIRIARKVASTDATTLILGESGTGKEICAQAIHDASARRDGPFIPVNCGAIPEALFESELFGYERGTFTGAEKQGRAGKIEMADGGTLFLDEIGELPKKMQVKLLRVLQENRVFRIGDSKGRRLNVRFIAATNQDLEKLMNENKFRSDLYYRLDVIQVKMPSLRERTEDIPELANYFLKQFAAQYQMPVPLLKEEVITQLVAYKWPGNIRELRNLMERITVLAENGYINWEELTQHFNLLRKKVEQKRITDMSLLQEKEELEKERIIQLLEKYNGNKSVAAKKLGISRVTLYKKIQQFKINTR
ncbi:sigma-54 interaction domain-containing protein [Virgibacillus chiguensis]|uniref:PAS domain S-box-containing protein n=3 Tax=Virgibacillus TaxID=84406 RepID=A0A1M5QR21_9BACI|nr:sigma 54-interacting transcriptional regulator [Virgibacillus chiguensis]SHH16522.1 PAS domain S-box-containing protein [Virgibacillus chiguensis]